MISKFINSIKNGLADSTTTDDGGAATSNPKIEESVCGTSSLGVDDNMYEINLWYEKSDIKFLSVKKLEKSVNAATAVVAAQSDSLASGQGSSNGSVSSLPQFSLPSQKAVLSSSGSTTESSERNIDLTVSATEVNKTKHLIKGLPELCAFMINHFTQIRSSLPGYNKTESQELIEDKNTTDAAVSGSSRANKRKLSTPSRSRAASGRDSVTKRGSSNQQRHSQSPVTVSDSSSPVSKEGRSSKMSCESPLSVSSKVGTASNETPSRRGRKRSISKVISDEDEDEKPKAKQAKKVQQQSDKQSKQQQQQGQSGDVQNSGLCVLAKWVDKKFYAGRILEAKPGNKFVVRFEDGALKVLQKDLIVFGHSDGTLPLKDHKIYALVDDDYECGIVISVDKINNKVLYTVKAETSTVKVTASDIYLQDDQAKIIQNLQQNSQLESVVQDLINSAASPTLDASSSLSTSSTRHTRHKRISGGGSPLPTATTAISNSPEPGTSTSATGTGTRKGGKRQKRYS